MATQISLESCIVLSAGADVCGFLVGFSSRLCSRLLKDNGLWRWRVPLYVFLTPLLHDEGGLQIFVPSFVGFRTTQGYEVGQGRCARRISHADCCYHSDVVEVKPPSRAREGMRRCRCTAGVRFVFTLAPNISANLEVS